MSNLNQLLYFASQSYRQVQLSVDKGATPYAYSDFATQFTNLLEASGDETYARQLTIELVEETARHKQTTDYLRQELAFEARASALGDRTTALESDRANHSAALSDRRMNRQANRTNHLEEAFA
ncbi:hypothetical protein [Spirosoma areae]